MCVFLFIFPRYAMISQDPSLETRTLSLRTSCSWWSVSTQHIQHVWPHCGVRANPITKMHFCINQRSTHSHSLSQCGCFCLMRVSSHMWRTAPRACILSIEDARCGVLWLAGTEGAVVWLPGRPRIQQPNCCNFHDEANLLKARPSLTLGCCLTETMRRRHSAAHINIRTTWFPLTDVLTSRPGV